MPISEQEAMAIAQLRLKAGETPEELKEREGLSPDAFAFWRKITNDGKIQPGPERQQNIRKALGISEA